MRIWFPGRTVIAVVCLGTLFGCASTDTSSNILSIQKVTPYRDISVVRENIRDRCQLDTRVPKWIRQYTEYKYDDVIMVNDISPTMKGSVLKLEITGVEGWGGGMYSGPKSLTIDGTLYKDGTVIGSFSAHRAGIWGGIWSLGVNTCKILARTAMRIGKDVGKWIENPTMNAKLGFRDEKAPEKDKEEEGESTSNK